MGKQISVRYIPEQDRWCVAWRTPTMAASSFWYFNCLSAAVHAMRGLGWRPAWI